MYEVYWCLASFSDVFIFTFPYSFFLSSLSLPYLRCCSWEGCGLGVNHTQHYVNGTPAINNATFPDMKGLVDYGHSKGLKMGWYVTSHTNPPRLTASFAANRWCLLGVETYNMQRKSDYLSAVFVYVYIYCLFIFSSFQVLQWLRLHREAKTRERLGNQLPRRHRTARGVRV